VYQNRRDRGRAPSRPIRSDSPLGGRRLWEIGSWGNASDQIGRRWEEIGREALTRRLSQDECLRAGPRPPVLLSLTGDDSVQSGFQAIGLTNPDALLVGQLDGHLSLRPVDFKWSLETAAYRQISGAALSELLAHPGSPLPDLIRQSDCADGQSEPVAGDGFFFVPDSRPNHEFLESPANRRQEFPIEPKEVVFEKVDGVAFFGSLPWWPQALRLAQLDRMERSLETLEGAERYYRLGAGLGGALLKLNTSIFAAEPPPLDVSAAIDELLQRLRLRSSLEVIGHLRQLMDQRGERLRRLKELARCPYSFREMLGDLAARGVVVPEGEGADRAERERWGQVHRAIASAHREAVDVAGLELVGRGQSEPAALAALERRRPEFADRARAYAHRLIRQELADGGAGS